mmetsp:Transcript_15842/g.37477  ORF Transcript_15842/g.37477 Transcript_15842/m.37477 type:complete len:318 (+) Transcript_15842:20-973(+)|eukprot:CAMPEP_0114562616 /NCGR_PEP_ID=MMETSP0114-20121206/12631_1 /TAXON_ID=31324 /ORGANISM="Goniomonas sp, Strain m" /LENGTH=317 /DNA_ID=CAMNT_0001748327 /DNA_START=19 /DNA_END=972 /DNA_ORIENTATION=+
MEDGFLFGIGADLSESEDEKEIKAVEIQPPYYAKQNEPEWFLAEGTFDSVKSSYDEGFPALKSQAEYMFFTRQFEESAKLYEQLLACSIPGSMRHELADGCARAYLSAGRPEKALPLAQGLVEPRKDITCYALFARCLDAVGQTNDSVLAWEQAVACCPRDPAHWVSLSEAFLRRGLPGDKLFATRCLQRSQTAGSLPPSWRKEEEASFHKRRSVLGERLGLDQAPALARPFSKEHREPGEESQPDTPAAPKDSETVPATNAPEIAAAAIDPSGACGSDPDAWTSFERAWLSEDTLTPSESADTEEREEDKFDPRKM